MKKIAILFVLLFVAFSAKAQLVYQNNLSPYFWPFYNGTLSFNGPPVPDYVYGSASHNNIKYTTTWHGLGHAWVYSSQGSGIQDPLDQYATRFEMIVDQFNVKLGTNKNHVYFVINDRATNYQTYNTLNAGDFISWGGNFYTVSDMTAKTNIIPVSNALNTILALKPVTYQWRDQSRNKGIARATTNPKEIGFIAQDLVKVTPDAVAIHDDQMIVNYQALIPILTAAIQELNARIEVLENQLNAK